MDFIALDVETADEDLATICCIGLAYFKDGKLVDTWKKLVNPEVPFHPYNTSIHGINRAMVKNEPTFKEVSDELFERLGQHTIAHHTHFDKTAIKLACEVYEISQPKIMWLDTARVVRRTWEEVARKGYGLANLTKMLGIEFKHHDAAEDARAAGLVLIEACKKTGLNIEEWKKRVAQSLSGKTYISADQDPNKPEANPDGILFGEEIMFTGRLIMDRREAMALAAQVGCKIGSSVKKTTTILVVGDQDIRVLHGHEKSSKHRKAESLIAKGQHLRILQESDFLSMVGIESEVKRPRREEKKRSGKLEISLDLEWSPESDEDEE